MLRQTVHFLDALNGFVTKAAMWLIVPLVGIDVYKRQSLVRPQEDGAGRLRRCGTSS